MSGIDYKKFQPTELGANTLTALFEDGQKQGMDYLAIYTSPERHEFEARSPQFTFLSVKPKPKDLEALHKAVWRISPLGSYFVNAVYDLSSPSIEQAKIEFRDPETGMFLDQK